MRTKRYKVTNMEGTVSIFVTATNQFDALDKARELSGSDDFRVVEQVAQEKDETSDSA